MQNQQNSRFNVGLYGLVVVLRLNTYFQLRYFIFCTTKIAVLSFVFLGVPFDFFISLAGRLHRDYESKRDVIIYDYVDAHIRVLESMYYKRLCTYRRIGYEILAAPNEEKQTVNAIFDSESYLPVYEKDLMQARKSIYIASPGLNKNKVRRLIALVEEQQTAGVIVTVITQPAESYPQTRVEPIKALQTALTAAGIYVVPQPDLHTHFAVIDQEIVWYGSTNLLSRDKEDDGLMRIGSRDVALELLEEIGR